MTALVVRADSRRLPLADSTVDLVVTSPPYFGLRSYQDGGVHYAGQVGDEATPAEFVAALLAVTAECVRVLKPSGSIWVNLGDKYAPGKSLLGLPWRYALACIDDLGLILRAEVIWSKPNGLPESVTDRVRRSHETWFHFTKEPRYFSAVDEVREPTSIGNRTVMSWAERKDAGNVTHSPDNGHSTGVGMAPNPLGKLPGSVWTIPTQPLQVPAHLGVDHFAAFPMEWPRRIIRGWSPSGICVDCGEGRRPVTERSATGRVEDNSTWTEVNGHDRAEHQPGAFQRGVVTTITGEACACACPDAATRPAVVLDPFGGTGTTALVASALGRTGISCDLSHDYSRLARWRTTDPGQRAAAMQVEKPKAELPGQADLFGEEAA